MGRARALVLRRDRMAERELPPVPVVGLVLVIVLVPTREISMVNRRGGEEGLSFRWGMIGWGRRGSYHRCP